MAWSPILLVGVILAGVVICVSVALIALRLRSDSLGVKPLTFVAILVFCTSLPGFLVTNFSSPTLATWWHALLVRVVWQLGGAVFLAIMVVSEGPVERPLRVFAVVLLLIGMAISFNPLRDLIEGPLLLRGRPSLKVVKFYNKFRGKNQIWGTLRVTNQDGSEEEVDLAGWGATEAIEKLDVCREDGDVELVVLRHVERVLDVRCELAAPPAS